jgi:hypothetical protein
VVITAKVPANKNMGENRELSKKKINTAGGSVIRIIFRKEGRVGGK